MLGSIGLFLRASDNDYQQRLKDVAQREAKRQGFDLIIESAQNDPERQAAQVRAALQTASSSKLVAVLVSTVREDNLLPVARETAEAGVDFAILNEGSFIDEIRDQFPSKAIFAVTADQMEIGRIQGHQTRTLFPIHTQILCVSGPLSTIVARQRMDGLKEVLGSDYPLIELQADWTSEGARMAVERWAKAQSVQSPLPPMLIAHNDEMALGVRQAVRDIASQRDLSLVGTFITGCDGSQTFGQRLVKEARIKSTVIMPPSSGMAIEWIARSKTRHELPPVRVIQPVTSFPSLPSLKP
jgi:ABC-type sugar transport system substrate-binding protein